MNENLIEQFARFKQTFTGDAKTEVMRMVQSGKITQAQLNQAQAMATKLMQILK